MVAYVGTEFAYVGTKKAYVGTKKAYVGTKKAYVGTKNFVNRCGVWGFRMRYSTDILISTDHY